MYSIVPTTKDLAQTVNNYKTEAPGLKAITHPVEIEDCVGQTKGNILRQLRFMAFFNSHLTRTTVTPFKNGTAQNLPLLLFSMLL